MLLSSCLLGFLALSWFTGTAALQSWGNGDIEEQEHVPVRAREDFLKLFQRNDAGVSQSDILDGKELKLVVGIAVAPQHRNDRNVHRDTWFTSPLVCRGEFGTPKGCAILPKFILEEGSLPPKSDAMHARLQKEEEEHHDLAFVPGVLAEKTRQWLAEAARRYPDAKYIGKMDSDTYVSPLNLIDNLRRNEESHPVIDYFGYFLDGAHGGFVSEGEDCDTRTECCSPPEDCTFKDGFSEACWVYAQGGFYLVSQTVAKHVSKLLGDKQPAPMNYACEDSILGKWIQSSPSRTAVWGAGSSLCRADCLEGEGEVLGWYHMYYSQKEPWDGIRGKGL
jgi:hypothetical protein